MVRDLELLRSGALGWAIAWCGVCGAFPALKLPGSFGGRHAVRTRPRRARCDVFGGSGRGGQPGLALPVDRGIATLSQGRERPGFPPYR